MKSQPNKKYFWFQRVMSCCFCSCSSMRMFRPCGCFPSMRISESSRPCGFPNPHGNKCGCDIRAGRRPSMKALGIWRSPTTLNLKIPNNTRIPTTKTTLVMLPNTSSMRMFPVHADFRIRMRINADVPSARVTDPQWKRWGSGDPQRHYIWTPQQHWATFRR